MRIEFKVSFKRPEGASVRDMQLYTADAVATMKGSLCPGDEEYDPDPMFELDGDSVKVTQLYARRRCRWCAELP